MRIRDWLHIGERTQRRLTIAMQFVLVGVLFIGFDRGDTGLIVNSGVALIVTSLPPILERDFGIPMDAGLTLWITTAVFLHAVGTLGVPGAELNFYQTIWWWDHLTHALSASIVAAVGYSTARALDEHSDEIYLPPRFLFVYILLFVVAFGVLWEVIEFGIGQLGDVLGEDAVLTQYGLEDTMLDLVFDTAGGVVVAIWGTAHLTDVVGAITTRLDTRQAARENERP